jgi:glyoxylase-like metal-dependent hydrolase (beta-lactamase superfamily II)
MSDETASGFVRIPLPLSGSPLDSVNVYAVSGREGLLLIDCGWDTPESYEALRTGLEPLGGIESIGEIIVTHIHPDHFGLAGRLARESGARISAHRLEVALIDARYRDVGGLVAEMEDWLRRHGAPENELEAMAEGSLRMLERVAPYRPDRTFEGGERVTWGEHELEVVWTPGHSPGLICLYDRNRRTLLSSDHVLPRISPHVGLHTQSSGNPLGEYLGALSRIRALPTRVVLPGHGSPFSDLEERVGWLVDHHEERLQEIEGRVNEGFQTAYAIAERLSWRGSEDGWESLEPFQRRMALTEVIAHLELLRVRGTLQAHSDGRTIRYAIPVAS